ncbi:MAG: MgtC/SapB family protein [Hyphomicrobiaceae bacterium]|nr:MgtC/SapB family protein [Hyphomicrobiaceae bacterium]
MDTFELFQRLSLALAIGLLIGLERGWQARDEAEGERAAGLRTLTLIGLLGGVWGAIAQALDAGAGVILGIAFAVTGGTIVLFRLRETVHDETFGATTAVAALVAFSLGVLAVVGDMAAAAAAGVLVTALLAFKGVLHGWLRRLTWAELRSALVLLAMTFLALPVLPNRTVDPLAAINPFEIWLLTVMIAVISFAGYVAIKLTGERRGIALTGLLGGLASSTAATLTLARLAPEHPQRQSLLAGGALISGATMLARVLVLVAVVKPPMLEWLALPLGLAAVVTAGSGLFLLARPADRGSSPALSLNNPLDLPSIIKFGVLLTVIGLLARVATRAAGSVGAYILAALSGIADVDAITLSMTRLAGNGLSLDVAAVAVLIVVAVNSLAKAALAWVVGGRQLGLRMAAATALACGALAAGGLLGPLPLARWLAAA